MSQNTPIESGFYLAKSNKGHWYTVYISPDGGHSYTSEGYGIENMPAVLDFVEWVKVDHEPES